ncbi:TonB-dependent receptor [Leptospira sp. 96542]|nr:TonB-dependent receptor [Leptospira sp. 96542]
MQQHTFLAPLPHLRLRPSALAVRLALAGLMVAGTSAGAQEQATEKTLAEITVSASADASAEGLTPSYAGNQVARGGRVGLLGNQDIMDTPFSTTAYTHALIQDQQAKSVADVLQNDPSVRLARGFGTFQELYMIRGFNVYSDDMSYNGLYGLLPRQYLAAELIERVEVFRGASAFLNGAAPGSSGIGGSINVLPKRAGNEPLTQVTLGAESGGRYSAAVDMARRFGEDQSSGLRINAVHRDGEGSVENEKQELSMLTAGWDWRSRNVRLSADLGYQNNKNDQHRPSVYIDTVVPSAAPDASKNFAQSWTYTKEEDTFGTVRGEVDFNGSMMGWAAAGMRKGKESNRLADPTVTNANGDVTFYRYENEREDDIATAEVGLRGKAKTGMVNHAWALSTSVFRSKEFNAYGNSYSGGLLNSNLNNPVFYAMPGLTFVSGDLADPLLVSRVNLSSVAVADTLSFLDDRLMLTVGARNQTMESFGYNYDTGVEESHNKKTKTTPIAGIVYKASQQISTYANYIEGLEKGPVAPSYATNAFARFAPQVSEQKEVGVKYDAGKFGGSLAYFSTTRPGSYLTSSWEFMVEGEQQNQGVELNMFGTPMKGLRLLGGVTLLDTEQKTSDSSRDGKEVIGVPKTMANVGADWDVPGTNGLSLNGRVVYTSSQYVDGANTLEIPSWTRLDIGVRYLTTIADNLVTWRARIDNVTDKSYWASAGGYPGEGYLVLGAPRTLNVSATIDF